MAEAGGAPAPDAVLIVGAGAIARAHAAVLRALGAAHHAVCRSETSAEAFRKETGAPCTAGGLEALLATGFVPGRAVVAVPVADLADVTIRLIDAGAGSILVEKPAGATAAEIAGVAAAAAKARAKVFVAYNRRFYESVREARRQVAADGGVTSFSFEFTEISDRVAQLPYPAHVLANWELANSTHVIDTAFFLGGRPAEISARTAGSLPWHPRCARFAGHGSTETGALFSFNADWDAPGRWGIEVNTRLRRFVLRPMEALQIQERGRFDLTPVPLDDAYDNSFKPGFYRQADAFLTGRDGGDLVTIADHAESIARIARLIMLEPAP